MKHTKETKKLSTRDMQDKILKIVLRRNPEISVSDFAKSFNSMRKYFRGEEND